MYNERRFVCQIETLSIFCLLMPYYIFGSAKNDNRYIAQSNSDTIKFHGSKEECIIAPCVRAQSLLALLFQRSFYPTAFMKNDSDKQFDTVLSKGISDTASSSLELWHTNIRWYCSRVATLVLGLLCCLTDNSTLQTKFSNIV